MSDHYPFLLKKLPYSYDALEPYIDEETVRIHHTKHQQKYVDNLNNALEGYPQYQSWSLEKLLTEYKTMPSRVQLEVRNNAGGVYNHDMYFYFMSPNAQEPKGLLLHAINCQFGSLETLKSIIKAAALSQFGSGYAWLVSNINGKLSVEKTANQDSILSKGLYPLLVVDVWEHAYYLKYQNRRNEYIDAWLNLADWTKAQECYRTIVSYKINKRKKHS